MGTPKVTYIQQREFGIVLSIHIIWRWKVWFQWHYDFSFRKVVIKCHWIGQWERKPKFVIQWYWNIARFSNKTKCKWRCIQLCAEECSEEEPPESYERKLETVETGRNNEVDDTENFFEKAKEEQDIQSDSKKKGTMFYPSKLAEEIIVIKSDDE